MIIGHQNIPQALFEIRQILRQAQNGHNLAGYRDNKAVFPGHAVEFAAQPYNHVAQGPVVHIHTALDKHAAGIDAQGIPLLHMIIQHSA